MLSPNGDGVDDPQTFTYKLVRPSQVTATLIGPDRSTRTLVQDAEQPGVHTLEWDGERPRSRALALLVSTVGNRRSGAYADGGHCTFALNQTLASLQVAPSASGLAATF